MIYLLYKNDNLTAEDSTLFRFATDGEGNYGYLKADDSFVPFKSGYAIPKLYAAAPPSYQSDSFKSIFEVSVLYDGVVPVITAYLLVKLA